MLPDPARRGAQARETFLRDARDAKLLAQLKNAPPSTITEQDIRVMQRLKLRRLYGEVESKFYRQASKTQLLPVFRDGGVVWKTARKVGRVKEKIATYLARAKGGGARYRASEEAVRLECSGAFDDPNTPKAYSPRPRAGRTDRRPRAYCVGRGNVVCI